MFGRESQRRRKERELRERAIEDARQAADSAREALAKVLHDLGPEWQDMRENVSRRTRGARDAASDWVKPTRRAAKHAATGAADKVRDTLVDSVLPLVVAAALDSRKDAPQKRPSRRKRTAVVATLALAAIGGALIVAWARRQPTSAPGSASENGGVQRERLDDLREAVNRAVGSTAAALKHTGEALGVAAGAAIAAFTETMTPSEPQETPPGRHETPPGGRRNTSVPTSTRIRQTVRNARDRATLEMIAAMDDVEDVWDDEPWAEEAPPTPSKKTRAKKAPAAAKPSSPRVRSTRKPPAN